MPALQDIFRYIGGQQETYQGPTTGQNESGTFTIPAQTVPTFASQNPAIEQLIQSGAIKRDLVSSTAGGQNESGSFSPEQKFGYTVNLAALPKTPWGDPSQVRPMDTPSGQAQGGFKLKNPNLVYNDPNYGPITPTWNTIDPSSQRNFYDLIGPLVMSAVLGGAGMGLFGPAQAGQGLAAGLGQGVGGALRTGGRQLPLGSIIRLLALLGKG